MLQLTDQDKKEIRMWVDALRGGEYKQSSAALQTNEGFCCLGVACVVLIPRHERKLNSRGRLFGAYPCEQPGAPNWLKEINADLSFRTGIGFAYLNDFEQYTFDQIADEIEKVYLLPSNL